MNSGLPKLPAGPPNAVPQERKPCRSCGKDNYYERYCPGMAELLEKGICHWNMNVSPRWWYWGTSEAPGSKITGIQNGVNHKSQILVQYEQFKAAQAGGSGGTATFGSVASHSHA